MSSIQQGERSNKYKASIVILTVVNLCIVQFAYQTTWGELRTLRRETKNVQQNSPPMDSGSILDYPKGKAVALPSVRITEEEEKEIDREIYGGEGDKKHLGGFTDIDLHGISPAVWKHMIRYFGVKTLLDVGCGRGISTVWFALHGVDTLCVEGSHDAVSKTMLPDPAHQVVEHDFSRGPWWPPQTVDAVWSVEFLEHVGRNYMQNYLPSFRKGALLFVTHSLWGGWHHVEIHNDLWWISKFEAYGFRYSQELTQMVKGIASAESGEGIPSPVGGQMYGAQHLFLNLLVFINPAVASLPQHEHLFSEHGCLYNFTNGVGQTQECGKDKGRGHLESRLPESFLPLNITDDMDKAWEALVRKNIGATDEKQ